MIFVKYFLMILMVSLLLSSLIESSPEQTNESGQVGWYSKMKVMYHGIPVGIRFYPKDAVVAKEAWEILDRVDEVFNDYQKNSEIGKVNQLNRKTTVSVSNWLKEAFVRSIKINQMTEGAFDITVKPLFQLWRLAEKKGKEPTKEAIQNILTHSNMKSFSMNDKLELYHPGVSFDFGGLVKGMAVDAVIELLKKKGSTSALVQVGGETSAYGMSMRGKLNVIGIQHPIELDEIWSSISDPGQGISASTSGNYRNPLTIGGKEYYHILDPRTGYPVHQKTLSVSVCFPQTGKNWLTDSLCTAGAVLGPEKTISIIEKLGGEVLFLIRDGDGIHEIKSKGWNSFNKRST